MLTINPPVFEPPDKDSFESSLWHETAISAPSYPRLEKAESAGALVIGAGYTGLSAAIALAESGVDTVVLDAREPGFGASGRNGGQVIPAFKYDPDQLGKMFGEDTGQAVLDMVSRTADAVFDLVRRFDIACEPTYGWIQAAHNQRSANVLASRCEQWRERGAPVDMIDAAQLKRLLGTDAYGAGVRFRHAGTVQPLSYARGLAAAAQSLGVRIYTHTPVLRLDRSGRQWRASTERATVGAAHVVIATNGYSTPIWPGLRKSIVPVYSMQIATDPLPESIRQAVMPVVRSMADTRRLVRYARKDGADRFIIGTRGPFRARPGEEDVRGLVATARALYPALQGIAFPYRWAGRVAMTADHIPHLHRLAPGVVAGLGYNGRGVGMATMMGRILAAACVGDGRDIPAYPYAPLKPIPFHMFYRAGVQAMVAYYRMLDSFG